jgi:hypothetical protein
MLGMVTRIALVVVVVAAVCGTGCNRRVFERVNPTCDVTIASEVEIPREKAADILIVVDNSISMQEEQDRLAAAFLDETASCPIAKSEIKDFARCDEADPPPVCRFANPSKELLAQRGPEGLADCGFIQVLAAFENDFRIGVITTDVGLCDNRYPQGQADRCIDGVCAGSGEACAESPCRSDWGFRPQRGCLQPNGPPGTPQKVISRRDLTDDDLTNDELGDRFIATLNNIRTFGTSIERGLDAVDIFLNPETVRPESCITDRESFIRDDARLIVIFLTDEEDCSRAADVAACSETTDGCGPCESDTGCEIFPCPPQTTCVAGFTELTGEVCGDNGRESFSRYPARDCYVNEDALSPVSRYVEALRRQKPNPSDVSVAVIAGGIPGADGGFVPAGCRFNAENGLQPVGGCTPAFGNSNSDECAAPDANCCFADPGGRYYEVADALGGLKDTICVDSFGQTMIKIAVFIADVDKLTLVEPPTNPALVYVERGVSDSQDFQVLSRLSGTTCEGRDGWVLENDDVTIRFCGDARPGPGELVRVRAKGEGATSTAPDACVSRGE